MDKKSFEKLLAWLSPDIVLAVRKYKEIYSSLVEFFRSNGCNHPTELADKTIDRVCTKLSRGEKIVNAEPKAYFLAVSRYILKEYWRQQSKISLTTEEISEFFVTLENDRNRQSEEHTLQVANKRLDCMKACVLQLATQDRRLIINYAQGEKTNKIANRRKLAKQIEISEEVLRTKVHRIRNRLKACLENCLKQSLK